MLFKSSQERLSFFIMTTKNYINLNTTEDFQEDFQTKLQLKIKKCDQSLQHKRKIIETLCNMKNSDEDELCNLENHYYLHPNHPKYQQLKKNK